MAYILIAYLWAGYATAHPAVVRFLDEAACKSAAEQFVLMNRSSARAICVPEGSR